MVTQSKQVEFFFDVGSPYSYLASVELPRICARRQALLVYRPMLLGAVFKATGNHSPVEIPAKSRWMHDDLARWAARYHAPFSMNPNFPLNTLSLMRGAAGMLDRSAQEFDRYLSAVMNAMWVDQRNLNDPAEVARVVRSAGFDPTEFAAMIALASVKDRLKSHTDEAIRRGVFGAPTFFIADQMHWGNDRLPLVDEALGA
jgi:2-hydroxychromene-2-carboxylate isomerase